MTDSIFTIVIGIIGAIVIGGAILYGGTAMSNSLNDLETLGEQECRLIPISDKFTSVSGGAMSASTNYYITSGDKTYTLIISTNPPDMQKFRQMNGSVEVKTYKSYAAFCDYKLMGGV